MPKRFLAFSAGLATLVVAILFAVMASVTVTNERGIVPQPAIKVDLGPDVSNPLTCAAPEERAIIRLIEEARSCNTDGDCTLAEFGCPFGCVSPINVAHVERIQRKVDSYRDRCFRCWYRCGHLAGYPACRDQRCVYEPLDLRPNNPLEGDSEAAPQLGR